MEQNDLGREGSPRLRFYPDSILRAIAHPIKDMDDDSIRLLDTMAEIMHTHEGIGLAAPQVGVTRRIIVADIGEGLVAFANPEIVEKEGNDRLFEGCLSLPGIEVDIARSQVILVRGIDRKGVQIEQEYTGLMARVIQHEVDHLNGVLIIDYASPIEKIALHKKMRVLRMQHKVSASEPGQRNL